MTSYLEWVYLFQVGLYWSCCMVTACLFNSYIHQKRCLWISVLFPVVTVFFFEWWNDSLLVLFELVILHSIFGKYSMMFVQLWLRYLIVYTLQYVCSGTIYQGIWYMEKKQYLWLAILLGMIVLVQWMMHHKTYYQLHEYTYRVTIRYQKRIWKGIGYWDSGNFANCDGIPILFVHDEELNECLMKSTEYSIVQTKRIAVLMGTVEGIQIPCQKAYLAYLEQPIQGIYDCLLNQGMERGNL